MANHAPTVPLLHYCLHRPAMSPQTPTTFERLSILPLQTSSLPAVALMSVAFSGFLHSVKVLKNDVDHSLVVAISLFVAVMCLCIIAGHLLLEYPWINESIVALLIGFFTGIVVLMWSRGGSSHILRFNDQFFFIYLLPPIIFNSGFQVKKKSFFSNFVTIFLFGVVGVFISSAIISAGSWWLFPKLGLLGLTAWDYLAIGAIFSSTNTICTLQVLHQDEAPTLYSLVFGEGVVNYATAVALFKSVQRTSSFGLNGLTIAHIFNDFIYLFSASTILGVVTGLLTAYAIKALYFGRHSSDREIALMVLMAYLSYVLAELLYLSGILTVFFCGIVLSHYAWHNGTRNSRITTRHIFATMSFIAETFIFLYVGMDALDMEKWILTKSSFWTSIGIYSSIIVLVLLGRAAFVFPLSALSNYLFGDAENPLITFRHQVLIWWAGLMRGAVSIALAFNQFTLSGVTLNPIHATIVTTTIIVVVFSTLVFGFLTKPLVSYLHPSYHQVGCGDCWSDPSSPKEEFHNPSFFPQGSSRRSISSMFLQRPAYTIHYFWRRFDDSFMRPVFCGQRRPNA